MDSAAFQSVVTRLFHLGWAFDDIAWAEKLAPPETAGDFAAETIFVICNSGMRFTVAQQIFSRVSDALYRGQSASTAFGHKGKCGAIDLVWRDREELLAGFLAAEDQLAFCASIPWIGGITKYHLAKNFGVQVAKPDVHLQRLADQAGCTAQELCERLAQATNYKVATVDTLLWRACAVGVVDSRTGAINLEGGRYA